MYSFYTGSLLCFLRGKKKFFSYSKHGLPLSKAIPLPLEIFLLNRYTLTFLNFEESSILMQGLFKSFLYIRFDILFGCVFVMKGEQSFWLERKIALYLYYRYNKSQNRPTLQGFGVNTEYLYHCVQHTEILFVE